MKKTLIISIIFIIFINNNAFAYFDPGTGSIILQSILGAVVASTSYCTIYWLKIKDYLYKKTNKKNK
jgi:hypothetical protein|tara:strand:+ start:380 stop:580 length:201 start_codon:yes stop_codon:yes gene_type:complete